MNKVVLIGRLTREPDIRYSQGERQMAIARFTLAIDRKGHNAENGQPSADFIPCVAFDRRAEFVEKWLHQGTKIALYGHIRNGSYTKPNGEKVYTTDVIADEMEFAESKASSVNTAAQMGYSAGTSAAEKYMNINDGMEDDDLPFR